MRNRTLYIIMMLVIAGFVTAVAVATVKSQSTVKYYAYVLKAKNPEFAQKGPKPEDAPLVQAHIKYMQGMIEKGVCILAGHTLTQDETGFGIAIIKTDSASKAREIMEHDPLVQAGILQGTIFPFDLATAPDAVRH